MEQKSLRAGEKIAYGVGAVGKDMVYMLSASYILYYYQDIMGVSAWAMGIILLIARVFDAFNDPLMGIVVAKTNTRFGKFRPWLLIGTLTNAVFLVLMFSAPPALNGGGLVAYAAVMYVLWGVTYTMMDIPYWSMIPAFTKAGKEREGLSALARSCAGVGSAIVTIITVLAVSNLGKWFGGTTDREIERIGYRVFAIVVAVLFVVFTIITCVNVKEKSAVEMKAVSVKDMFKSLFSNDQAIIMVVSIVLINLSLYITSNLAIYFFKYDFSGPERWEGDFTLFNTAGGAFQILAMMALFPLFRNAIKMTTIKMFYMSVCMAFIGYVALLGISLSGATSIYLLLIPAFLIFSALGMLNVLITVFLANSVDYGEYKNGRRDESVIFSMQTFVVKLASGIAALIASLVLTIFNISSDENAIVQIASDSSRFGLRMCITIIPMILLVVAFFVFKLNYKLTDEKLAEITAELEAKKQGK